MRYKLLFVSVMFGAVCGLNGCSPAPGSPSSINHTTEVLEEGSFRFRYPTDWTITTEEKTGDRGERISTYNFRHPQTRECYVTIEIVRSSGGSRINSTNEIAADQTRFFKNLFEKSGYQNFSFTTSSITFANHDATRLVFKGTQSSVTREARLRIIPYKGDCYIIAYQIFDSWHGDILEHLENIVQSFEFIR